MRNTFLTGAVLACLLSISGTCVLANDWPQWRGANRDAKAGGFKAPKEWPKDLTKKWSIKVGDGVASPALAGDHLYVFSRDGDEEILRCLKAEDGKEVWAEKNKASKIGGAASGYPGPRSTPAVAGGKVVVIGVHGSLVCYEAASGKLAWRKDEHKGTVPKFYTSSSPIILDKLCVAQVGNGIYAYDLADGKEVWKWTSDSASYASPVLATLGKTKAVIAETVGNVVAVGAGDGKELWKANYKTRYNASSPVIEGDKVILAGNAGGFGKFGGGGGDSKDKGTKAYKLEASDGKVKATELWHNTDFAVIYNSPVIKDGLLYAISEDNKLFCLNMKDGKSAWDTSYARSGGGGGKGKFGGGGGGYGTVVDAGSVLMALTPSGNLTVFEPGEKAYKELAKYPVGSRTYAYPVVSGNRIFIKDDSSMTLWTVSE